MMIPVSAVLSISVLLTGCFAKIYELPSQPQPAEALFAPLADQDFMVGLAVSGGGSRAATFAAGALEALAEIPISLGTEQRSVLETVSYMSSVSGGSLATAYYVTNKPPRSEPMLVDNTLSPRYREFFSAYKTAMQSNFQRSALLRQLAFFRALNPTKLAYSFSEVWDEDFLGHTTFAQLYGLETVALRYSNVYGPRQNPHGEAGVVAIFGRRLLAGEPLTVYGDGEQTRDLVFVGDVAEANVLAAGIPVAPVASLDDRAFNIGTGVETSVNGLAEAMGRAAGRTPEVRHAAARPGELRRNALTVDKAARALGWRPRTVLARGLELTIRWLAED